MTVSLIEFEEHWSLDDAQDALDAMSVWDELDRKLNQAPTG